MSDGSRDAEKGIYNAKYIKLYNQYSKTTTNLEQPKYRNFSFIQKLFIVCIW